MANLVRPWVVEYRSTAGKRVKKGTPGAVKRRSRAAKWYGQNVPGLPKGKRVPLATDKQAARRMLDDLVRRAERGHAGIADPRPKPLAPLLVEYAAALGREAGPKQVASVLKHVRHLLAACKCRTVGDLAAPDLPARVEAAVWALTRPPHDLTETTAARYGKHARQFTAWLTRKHKLFSHDPLAAVDLPADTTATPRRDLTPAELAAVFAAAEASPVGFRHLTGPDRVMVYLLAAATGFRAGELARLTPDRFDLDADPPTVRPVPHGPRSKTKEGKPQPLPPAVAARLREYLAGRPADRRVWPGSWHYQSADMLRHDLSTAGVPEFTDAGQAVFHSLRHSFTSLVVGVADVKTAQELVRHRNPSLTIGRYAHTSAAAKAEAVGRMALPVPGGPAPAPDLTRDQLETLVGVLAGLLAVFAPRLAQTSGTTGDGPTAAETKQPPSRPAGCKRKSRLK